MGITMSKKSIGKNTLYNLLKNFSTVIFPLITFPYISRVLHADNVGKINFGNSIVNYILSLATLGITTYAVRECSKVKADKNKLDDIASQILSINIISTVFAYFILILLLIFWDALHEYRILILIQSISVIFVTLGAEWLNSAMEDFKYIAVRTFIFQFIALILMLLFVRQPEDYIKYAVISVISSSGGNIVNILYRRKYCSARFTMHVQWRKHLPPILFLFALLLIQTIFVSVDTTLLGIYKGDYEAGLYGTSTKIYNIINTLIASVAWVVMPQMTACYSKNDYDAINKLFKYTANIVFTLGLPCIVGVNMIASEIIMLVGGSEYLEAVPSLHILTVALLFLLLTGLIGNILFLPSGREKICFWIYLLGAVFNFIMNIIFIPRYGLNAAALTTAASQFITFIASIPFVEKNIKLKPILSNIIGPVLGCIGIIIIGIFIRHFVKNYIYRMSLIILIGALLYGIIQILLKNELVIVILNKLKIKHKMKN